MYVDISYPLPSFQNCYEMYKYLSEEPRSKNGAGKVGVASNNNHDHGSRHHRRRQQQRERQQQIERVKREIQIRAVISDDLDLDIEDDDDEDDEDNDEDKDNSNDVENNSTEPSIVEEGGPVPGGRCQGCTIRQRSHDIFFDQALDFNNCHCCMPC